MKTIKDKLKQMENVKIKEENGDRFIAENLDTKTFNFKAMKDAQDIKTFSVEKATVNGEGNLEATLQVI